MNPLLKRKTSSSSLKRKSKTSDRFIRKGKNPVIKSQLYKKTLIIMGIYISNGLKIINTSRALYKSLLEAKQPLPLNSLFQDDRFKNTYKRLYNENEAKVI
jgi:hypothetical protein